MEAGGVRSGDEEPREVNALSVDAFACATALPTWRRIAFSLLITPPRLLLCALSALLLVCASVASPRSVWPIKALCRVGLLSGGFYTVDVDGDLSKLAGIVVANHTGASDVLFLVSACAPRFIAKAAVKRIPYVGAAARALHCLFVDRADPVSRQETLAAIAASDNHTAPLVIFPESTSTNNLAVIEWAKGAFVPALPVTPLAFSYPARQRKPDTVVDNLLMLTEPRSRMHVTVLPVYHPSEEEKASPELYAENVRRLVAKTLDIPLAASSYKDGMHRVREPRCCFRAAAADIDALQGPLPWR